MNKLISLIGALVFGFSLILGAVASESSSDESREIFESDIKLNFQQLGLNDGSSFETVEPSSEAQAFPGRFSEYTFNTSTPTIFNTSIPTIWSISPLDLLNLDQSLEEEIPDVWENLNGEIELRMEDTLSPSNRTKSRYFPYDRYIPSFQNSKYPLIGNSFEEEQSDLNQDASQAPESAASTSIPYDPYFSIGQQTEVTINPW